MKTLILLFFTFQLSAQIDSMKVDVLYMGSESKTARLQDSIDIYNGYPRQDAFIYMDYIFNSNVNKYAISIDRVTYKHMKRLIIEEYGFPTMKIPMSIISGGIKDKINTELSDNNWNAFKRETYFWMFNFSKTADNKFTQIQIDYLINNGGTIWNFE